MGTVIDVAPESSFMANSRGATLEVHYEDIYAEPWFRNVLVDALRWAARRGSRRPRQ